MYRSEHTATIRKIIDIAVRAELEMQIDEHLDECERAPLHTTLPAEDDICIETIAERVIEDPNFEKAILEVVDFEVDMRFDAVYDELLQARTDRADEREYQRAHQPSIN